MRVQAQVFTDKTHRAFEKTVIERMIVRAKGNFLVSFESCAYVGK